MKAFGRILKFIATGSLSLLLTACYGIIQVMYGVPGELVRRQGRIRVRDTSGDPIQGLTVYFDDMGMSSYYDDQSITDAAGYAAYDVEINEFSALYAVIQDTDGNANGGDFGLSEHQVDSDDDSDDDITLSPQTSIE